MSYWMILWISLALIGIAYACSIPAYKSLLKMWSDQPEYYLRATSRTSLGKNLLRASARGGIEAFLLSGIPMVIALAVFFIFIYNMYTGQLNSYHKDVKFYTEMMSEYPELVEKMPKPSLETYWYNIFTVIMLVYVIQDASESLAKLRFARYCMRKLKGEATYPKLQELEAEWEKQDATQKEDSPVVEDEPDP